jgi:hypothetical protein
MREGARAGRDRQARPRGQPRLVDAVPLVDGREQVLAHLGGLGRAEEHATAEAQREVQRLQRT